MPPACGPLIWGAFRMLMCAPSPASKRHSDFFRDGCSDCWEYALDCRTTACRGCTAGCSCCCTALPSEPRPDLGHAPSARCDAESCSSGSEKFDTCEVSAEPAAVEAEFHETLRPGSGFGFSCCQCGCVETGGKRCACAMEEYLIAKVITMRLCAKRQIP